MFYEKENAIKTSQTNLMIVDDHRMVSNLFSIYLNQKESSVKLIGTAANCKQAREITRKNKIDVCLLDIMLPGMSGFEFAKELLYVNRFVKIIFLTALNSKKVINKAIELGASGFLTKSSELHEIHDAIVKVQKGDRYFCKDALQKLLGSHLEKRERENYIDGNGTLTKREKEALKLIVDENKITEIADKLHISPRTVQTHKKNIMRKLKVNTTVALVKTVYEKKLLDN